MTGPLLEVDGLRVGVAHHGRQAIAVHDVTFQLAEGQRLGLVGESGCGKSLTLRAILQLLPRGAAITGGRVRFGGRELTVAGKTELRRCRGAGIAMVFQEPMTALNPAMKVGRQIAEGPRTHLHMNRRQAEEVAVGLMTRVGIPDAKRRYESYPHELSGGLRQRVMIAIALSSSPKLLLCDEPTTALDVTIQAGIIALLREISTETGVALVFVTHDLAVVGELCDDVCVMYAGRIVESGPVAGLFAEPRHPYTAALMRAAPDFDRPERARRGIPGQPPDPMYPSPGCPFAPRCNLRVGACEESVPRLAVAGHGRLAACLRHEELAK